MKLTRRRVLFDFGASAVIVAVDGAFDEGFGISEHNRQQDENRRREEERRNTPGQFTPRQGTELQDPVDLEEGEIQVAEAEHDVPTIR